MVSGGDAEHADDVQRKAEHRGAPSYAAPDHAQACQVNAEERQLGPGEFVTLDGNRCWPQNCPLLSKRSVIFHHALACFQTKSDTGFRGLKYLGTSAEPFADRK